MLPPVAPRETRPRERSGDRPANRPPWACPQPDFGPTGRQGPVSDGSLYPAISRLTGAGLLERRTEPADHEITDFTRFFTVLAFLSRLPDEADQHAVLRRRLAFLEEPASFFYDGDRPLHAEEVPDRYRRGMLLTARAHRERSPYARRTRELRDDGGPTCLRPGTTNKARPRPCWGSANSPTPSPAPVRFESVSPCRG
ncbi:hypothetical protein [Streptomyces mirabilis]